ncbi:uncharacterized protein [Macaca nemestrina]|uniref:uncharacterized protein n=1 Tax=Macaca nemestrina TaxID=9545 RepID=UPI0039B97B0F
MYVEYPVDSTKKLVELVRDFSKVTGYKHLHNFACQYQQQQNIASTSFLSSKSGGSASNWQNLLHLELRGTIPTKSGEASGGGSRAHNIVPRIEFSASLAAETTCCYLNLHDSFERRFYPVTFSLSKSTDWTHAEDPERTAPRLQIPSSPDFGAAARPHQLAARTHMVTGPWPSPPTGAWVFEGPRRGAHVGARLPRRRQDRELGHGESDPEPTHEAARRLHESPPFPRLGCQLRNGSRRRRRSVVFRAPPFPPPLSPPPQGSSQADPLRSR